MAVVVLYVLMIGFVGVGASILWREWKQCRCDQKQKEFLQILFVLLVVGLFTRYININQLPGLQIDEAMSGYDTWALAKYGTDSALNSWPIYLIGYGTGPSAFYTYLSLPFVKILGLSLVSTRLAMVCLSSITILIVMWTLLRLNLSKKLTLSIFFMLIISPWHMLISRFGLDANVAPHLLLVALCLVLVGMNESGKKQTIFYSVAICLIGLTSYAYLATWYFLPLFLLFLLGYFLKNRYLNKMQIVILMVVLIVTIIPIVIFAYVQYVGQETITIFGVTFAKMIGSQSEGQTILFKDDIWGAFLGNLQRILGFLLSGRDGLIFSSIHGFGFMYNLAGLLLACLGWIKMRKEKSPFSQLTIGWFVCSLPLLLIIVPVVHHWNVVMFPLIIMMGYGLASLHSIENKTIFRNSIAFFSVLFVLYVYTYNVVYKEEQQDSTYMAPVTLEETLKVGNEKKLENIYIERSSLKQLQDLTFIFIRFYDPISPESYQASRDTPYDKNSNMTYRYYGKYVFLDENEATKTDQTSIGYLYHKGTDLSKKTFLKDFAVYENADFLLFYKE
ncbi:hypothetical protein [Enterococcus caccae]|uniref:Glycosyltransferase RgtA/B/C/D-like domain-containing protein n=1 Tax=Enterococcus caccae ATCC BAA-1240 TaxID=1158612 RepID=R3TPW8_9ENTE|nr:hypothetical protein [Enterococcus caccae]EOL43579.1 hypothetical protein UC7_02909 [Enterococcus caccae ATCC BAA-1240]EOT68021.1 hypothetical protein I580_00403 [Enterococcus caccae ATCC BAA-1240]OJG28490.1 hypothetical protein RU98_GL000083 [Enterococcus caccae]